MRKLFDSNIRTTVGESAENYFIETNSLRQDFDKMLASDDPKYVDAMLDKYEHYIEMNFQPDFPLHRSRPHSLLHGQTIQYTDS